MQTLEHLCPLAALCKSLLQLRMKFDQFAEGKPRLPTAADELLVGREVFMAGFSCRSRHHSGTLLLESVAQLNILHSVHKEFFVETTGLHQLFPTRRDVTCVVVREVHGTVTGNAVRVEDSFVAQIPKERVVCFFPRGKNCSYDRRAGMLRMVFQMAFDEVRLSKDVVINEEDN